MNRKVFYIVLIFVMAMAFTGCGDKYSEATDINNKFANATQNYMDALGKADSADSVASAIDAYAAKMEKIGPKIKEIAEKYPDLRTSEEVPEELEKSRENIAEVSKKMGGAMMNMMKYMGDPKVMEAQTRLQKAMATMAPVKETE